MQVIFCIKRLPGRKIFLFCYGEVSLLFAKRTDLALEAREIFEESGASLPDGVKSREYRQGMADVTCIDIESEEGERALGKARGSYITVALPELWMRDSDSVFTTAQTLAHELKPLLPESGAVLVVGLGNRFITPDAIGPLCTEHIIVTRHLLEQMPDEFGGLRAVCALTAGVLGLAGIETAEIVRGVVQRVHPSAVIAVDALASRSAERLCRAFQMSDTGVTPGSGVFNARATLDKKSLGVPVIAIGVPTVVDALTLTADTLEQAGHSLPESPMLRERENLMVTPKDIDALVHKSAKVIGYAINLALQGDLTTAEMEQFLS